MRWHVMMSMSAGVFGLVVPELGMRNKVWEWRGYEVRYTSVNEELDAREAPSVVLVHGLFANADHWRKNCPALADAGCRVFAIDLLGSGYSSKPAPSDPKAIAVSGERRFTGEAIAIVDDLGTASGKVRRGGPFEVPQRHPVAGSPYNFFTWSEQLSDFTREIVKGGRVALVCNSIGCISGLQAAIDRPDLFAGACLVSPNFRELHVAESPKIAIPATTLVQAALRRWGAGLFKRLANRDVVRAILTSQPYVDKSAVTDELVDVLLNPLLLPGADKVVFDTLSYSAGPLPEQLLQDPNLQANVFVCYGTGDPWTPGPRVEALARFDPVKRVQALPEVGHCPHDEAPHLVNPFLLDFLQDTGLLRQT
ncbi:hypothetical protein CTAYLR_007030 [Chrysophaeum taylorii]|uniref:AB hydrolase-1 domain-containing protein n=1 Tax=Chrysophaeum taylorii TaxID=2483200 RepID=A0AAD7U6X1_9STRA|nr:hypothetical protein CTAYLR_007030 [Chrysophaeum taylorii]